MREVLAVILIIQQKIICVNFYKNNILRFFSILLFFLIYFNKNIKICIFCRYILLMDQIGNDSSPPNSSSIFWSIKMGNINYDDLPLQDILDLLIDCGIPPFLRGYTNLARAVELYADGITSFNEIYRIISKECGVEAKSTLRSITYAINQAYDLAVNLSELVNINIPQDHIRSALVIAYLGLYVRRRRYADRQSIDLH